METLFGFKFFDNKVEYFNCWYILMFIFLFGSIFLLAKFVKNKSPKFQKTVVLILAFLAFLSHFTKLLFEPYLSDWPYSIRKVSCENICAVTAIIIPFVIMSKSVVMKDYIYSLGIIGGLGAFLVPTEPLGESLWTYDNIRFYLVHFFMIASSYLLCYTKMHKLDVKRLVYVPLVFIGVLSVIFVNEVILAATGFLQDKTLNDLLDPSYRNYSFIFGYNRNFTSFKGVINLLVPKFLRTHPFTKEEFYWPLIWMFIPAFVYSFILSFIFWLPFEYQSFKQVLINVINKLKRFRHIDDDNSLKS